MNSLTGKKTTSSKTQTSLLRDEYGALLLRAQVSAQQLEDIQNMLRRASAMKNGIPPTYCQFSKTDFECVNHDVYDVVVIRGKVRGLVVQVRWFWKHLRKTRSRMTKAYYLLSSIRNTVTVTELENATCAKRAKNTNKLGQLAAHYSGGKAVKCASTATQVFSAYKVMAKTADGRLVSAFDGSEYPMHQWRYEAAKPAHKGGFYCYLSETQAVEMTQRGATFHQNVSDGKKLVLCEVEISGRSIGYASGKRAVSKLRVIAELHSVELQQSPATSL